MGENIGKMQFDAIELPDALGDAVEKGVRRGRRRRRLQRSLSGLTAAVMLVFLTANVPALYARAAEVPLLGPLVRVMHVGAGGERVTGAAGHVQSGRDRMQLVFTDAGENRVPVPVFSAVQRETPRRVTLRVHGLAEGMEWDLAGALEKQAAVTEAYPLAVTDPTEQGVTFHLAPGWHCAVGEYADALELRFFAGDTPETPERYVLCSAPLPLGAELAGLTEALLWEGATQLRTAPEDYRVVLGEYRTEEQAERARQGILEQHGLELQILRLPDIMK